MPLQIPCSAGRVDHAMPQIPGTRGNEVRLPRDAGGLGTKAMEVADRGCQTGADIVSAFRRGSGGGQKCLDDVADVNEVTRLVPVAEDRRVLPVAHPIKEDRHHAPSSVGIWRGP